MAVTARRFWPLWPRQIAEVLRRDGRVIFLCMDWLALVAGDDSGIVPDLQVAVDQPPGGYSPTSPAESAIDVDDSGVVFDSQVAGSVSPAAYAPTSPAWSAIDADAAVAPPQNQLVAVASEAELQLVAVASSKLPGPRKRTFREHQLVAQKMVTGKLRKRMLRAEAGRAEAGGAQIEEEDARLDAQLRAAYPAQLSSVTTRALELAVSRSGLRDTACKVALTQMQLQANALLDVLEQVVEGKLRLRLFWEKYKWDETLQRLSMSSRGFDDEDLGDLLPNQMKSTWNVLVQKRWIGWVTVEGKVFEVPLVVPPVILAGSITAGCLWSAMFGEGKYAKSLQEFSEQKALAPSKTTLPEISERERER